MWRNPVANVRGPPAALEALAVARARPEFGLLEVDGRGAGVDRRPHPPRQIISERWPRAHVIDVASVRDDVSPAIGLGLIHVFLAIEAAIEVVLVVSPRHARHHMNKIALVFPQLHA